MYGNNSDLAPKIIFRVIGREMDNRGSKSITERKHLPKKAICFFNFDSIVVKE